MDIEDLRTFVEVADAGGVSPAARRLGVSKSIVSRRLFRLEAELGVQLLARTTRGAGLTEAGVTFRDHAARVCAEIDVARETILPAGDLRGRLRVAAPLTFGPTLLAPVFAELARRYPLLHVHASYSDRFVDLVGEGFDCAVRVGYLSDSNLMARHVGAIHGALVASPDYIREYGVPETPDELLSHAHTHTPQKAASPSANTYSCWGSVGRRKSVTGLARASARGCSGFSIRCAWSRIYLGIGLPLIFIPITTASYDGIPPDKTDQASALINLARNFGGSMGVALSQTVLARREQFHQSRLVEHIGSWNPFYSDTLNRIQGYLNGRTATGSSSGTSMAIVNQMVQTQATLLAYIDVFVALGVIAVVMVPLALTLRTVNRSAGSKSAH
jgi:DNA-binding transcriptional LysR family regulator